MIDDVQVPVVVRTIKRKSRKERTKRRERYLLQHGFVFEIDDTSPIGSPSSTLHENNNSLFRQRLFSNNHSGLPVLNSDNSTQIKYWKVSPSRNYLSVFYGGYPHLKCCYRNKTQNRKKMKSKCEREKDGSVDDINGVSSGEQITINESKLSNFDKLKRRYSFGEKFKFGKSSSSFNLADTEHSPFVSCGSSSFPNIPLASPYENLDDTKSESDITLEEASWKTAESSEKDSSDSKSCKSVISVESTRYTVSVDKYSTPAFVERTESVEDMQKMPAYGDLILDTSSTTSNFNQSGVKPKDHLYKILVIGDLGTGKTSIIKRYVHQFFSQHYRATIGVDFALKVLNWDANTLIRLQLWDIAGQERYGNMTRVYYKEAVGAFIVFDVTRVNTFESVSNWKADLDSKVQLPDGSPIPCVLLANKCDQQKEGLINSKNKMDEYCKEKGFSSWYETSAKENINIDEAARTLVSQILLNDKLINDSNKDGDQFSLGMHSNDVKKKSCNC